VNTETIDMAVVVCAFSEARWSLLAECVESLHKQVASVSEIIVVIDHNRALFEKARAAFTDTTVLENDDARGLSGARNTGIRHSSASIVAFIDDDAVAEPTWVRELAAPFSDPSILAVGGRIDPVWEKKSPRWLPPEFYWVVGCSYRGMPGHVTPIRNVIGANMAFRREVFRSVGLFRNGVGRQGETPFGCEETELSIRARQYWPQRQILFAPAAVVHHRIPDRRGRVRYFARRCFAEGRSKAQVTALVGSSDALATERTYTRETLPRGARTGILDCLTRGDVTGLARSAAITGGLLLTAAGYARGRITEMQTRVESAPRLAID
jgi:GT2 family glycosyltransferase